MGKIKICKAKVPSKVFFFSCVLEKTRRYTEESGQEICVEIIMSYIGGYIVGSLETYNIAEAKKFPVSNLLEI